MFPLWLGPEWRRGPRRSRVPRRCCFPSSGYGVQNTGGEESRRCRPPATTDDSIEQASRASDVSFDARLSAGDGFRIESSHRLRLHVDYIERLVDEGRARPVPGIAPNARTCAASLLVVAKPLPTHLLGTWAGRLSGARYDIDSARLPPNGGGDGSSPRRYLYSSGAVSSKGFESEAPKQNTRRRWVLRGGTPALGLWHLRPWPRATRASPPTDG